MISLDANEARLELLVDAKELERRKAAWLAPEPHYGRDYGEIFSTHVTQADEGCDFDFLARKAPTKEPEIH